MKLLLLLGSVGSALYLAGLLLLFFYQDVLVFPGSVISIPAIEVERVSNHWAQLANGRRFRYALAEKKEPSGVMLYFVGNGEDLKCCRYMADAMRVCGLMVYAPEYPGYGESAGPPSKKACLEAAEITAKLAQKRAKELGVPLTVAGLSLGTFMATHVAAQGWGQKLLLGAALTSVLKRGKQWFPHTPVAALLIHNFDSPKLAPRVQCETLLIHAVDDFVAPIHMGRRLARAFPKAELSKEAAEGGDPGRGLRPPHHPHWCRTQDLQRPLQGGADLRRRGDAGPLPQVLRWPWPGVGTQLRAVSGRRAAGWNDLHYSIAAKEATQ